MLIPEGEAKPRVRAEKFDLRHISMAARAEMQYGSGELISSTTGRFCNIACAKTQWKIDEVASGV